MAKQSDIADKLDEARALIGRAGGWARLDYECNGGLCALGAIRKVTSGDPFTWSMAAAEVADALLKVIPNHSIDSWNDAQGRTQAEVIEAFRKAAELARAEA